MGRYRARDLFLVPSLLSLLRVPLAVAFIFAVDSPPAAMVVLLASGLTDVFDGWYARRYDQVTALGTVVDPITDKIFVLTVVTTLVLTQKLTLVQMLLLGTRDIGELPLVLWLSVSRSARRARQDAASANVPGKLATALQFVAVAAALFASDALSAWVYVASGAGVVAAVSYWVRALRITPTGDALPKHGANDDPAGER